MHGGPRVGLGNHEQGGYPGQSANLRRKAREGLRDIASGPVPLHPERGHRDSPQLLLAVLLHQLVLPKPHVGEVVVAYPFQKGQTLLELLGIHGRRVRFQIGNNLGELLAHRLPVLHRGGHVAEHGFDIGDDTVQDLLVRLPVDLQMHDRFGQGSILACAALENLDHAASAVTPKLHHRVNDEVRRETASIERHAHGIHQERHVVGGELDNRVGGLPAVLLQLRVVDTQLRCPRGARAQEVPVGKRRSVEVGDVAFRQILEGGARVVLTDELLDHAPLGGGHMLAYLGQHCIDQFPEFGRVTEHGVLLPGWSRPQPPW